MLLWFMLIAITKLSAQEKNTQTVKSQLTNATVYYGYGVELNHTAKAALKAGLQEIVVNNIAVNVDANTIQIGCPENIVLMSYRFNAKTETKAPAISPGVKKMNDSLTLLQKRLAAVNNDYATTDDILSRTTKLIETTLALDGKKQISSAELIKLVDYYSAKVRMAKSSLYTLSLEQADLQEKINDINRRMGEITTPNPDEDAPIPSTTIGQLILQVMTKAAAEADFSISYFTPNAGWLPTYDVRVKTIDNTCKLAYKAAVSQSTGIAWKNVKLTLSTSNPNQSGTVPAIAPWYVQLYVPALYNKMTDAAKLNQMQNMGSTLQDVVVTNGRNYAMKDKTEESVDPSDVSAYTTLNQSQLYTNFEIDLPYDIPADGKAYSVSIKEEDIKATYKHYAVPKLDRDAFLIAHIKDWETLDLMPGDANIVMDNVYIGKSFIDPNTTTDTLNLSLGRDKRVAIKRRLVKELTKSKVKGDFKTETFVYEITVRNNKKEKLSMVLKDQYPLSEVKEVEITLDSKSGAEVNEEFGTLNWKTDLQPGEVKKFRFGYTVKYPKDKSISNLR